MTNVVCQSVHLQEWETSSESGVLKAEKEEEKKYKIDNDRDNFLIDRLKVLVWFY